MKVLVPLALCLALALPALALAGDATDPFAEFRIPDHGWTSGAVHADLSGSRSHNDAGPATDRFTTLQTDLAVNALRGWDSDNLLYDLSLHLSGAEQSIDSRRTLLTPFVDERQSGFTRRAGEFWALQGGVRAYPWEIPLGFQLSASVAGQYSQDLSRLDLRDASGFPIWSRVEQRNTQIGHRYRHDILVALAAGLGRVRDATVVQDVHVLEERLAETGALARPLSTRAREKLAALFYVAPSYAYAHDRPDRFVWRDVERILSEDGALSERGLDPYSLLRGRELYGPAFRLQRLRGWFVGPVSELRHFHSVDRRDSRTDQRVYVLDSLFASFSTSSGERVVGSFDEAMLGLAGEYHRPFGWRWQLDLNEQVTGPVRPGDRGLEVHSQGRLAWLIADRWQADGRLTQQRLYLNPRSGARPGQNDFWTVQYGASLAYYLEDHTSISASLAESQRRDGFFSRNGRFQLGLTYRFLGRLDASGLIEPQRPIH